MTKNMNKRRSVILFAMATLAPLPLLVLGAATGGVWIWLALAYLTAFAFLLDQLVAIITPDAPEGAEFPAADGLSATLAVAHFGLFALGVWAVSGTSGLSVSERIAAFFAFGLFFGQVSNSNAHELIHRGQRPLRALGRWVYISHLFGHHASAHPKVHHRFVATPDDPNSADLGESYYRFAPRAWIGSFRAGLVAENHLRRSRSPKPPLWTHPYISYVGGAVVLLALSAAVFGISGLLAHLALAGYATAQLLLSDYVQHYGLSRAKSANGRYEPVGERHSWNAPHWFSSYLMLNAPRHSDHHAHPTRAYPALHLPERKDAPTLPASLPAMATLALFPTLWRRVMDKRVARWKTAG
ncbi:alkane 1-monooxygenase [Actibacterium lipolyticum]|uniref:Alkane 1-monooxygenase 1 n=1 Tax=Actibacterium lipolyticum TaxID=1524263 RepID=A0A238KMR9_9RHOB|nr:alkane 1-monooxygenase [Actibacterium lipolyticum]SMX43346.1 Alkane 1-monooxygenase 1 [Actibacterium lipolyticum]